MSVTASRSTEAQPPQPVADDGSHEAINRRMHRTFTFHLDSLSRGLENVQTTAEQLAVDKNNEKLQSTYASQVAAVVAYSGMVLSTLHHHHKLEDKKIFDPLLRQLKKQAKKGEKRFVFVDREKMDLAKVIELMEGEHAALHGALDKFNSAVTALEKTTTAPSADAVAHARARTTELMDVLAKHCRTEEQVYPQLALEDFRKHDVAVKLIGFRKTVVARLNALMHAAGEESPAAGKNSEVPAPLQKWHRGGRNGTTATLAAVEGNLDTLGVTTAHRATIRSSVAAGPRR